VNKYREGKVKRTLFKGVKKILKFNAFMQSKLKRSMKEKELNTGFKLN